MSKLRLDDLLGLPGLPDQLKEVDRQLLDYMSTAAGPLSSAALRLIKAGGKRLRPSLTLACAHLESSNKPENVIKLAAAVELIHIASLIHDDIIDEADQRWHVPTINSLEGSAQAIVTGDFLFAQSCAVAATVGKTEALIVARTIMKLCNGQGLETAQKYQLDRSRIDIDTAVAGKTAALMSAASQLGGLAGGLNDQKLKKLSAYGHNFGMAFQYIDDLLDLTADPKIYGKLPGNDVAEGVYTLPVVLSLAGKNSASVRKILKTRRQTSRLAELLMADGSIATTIATIQKYNYLASQALTGFDSALARNMAELPAAYLNWSIANLVHKDYRPAMLKVKQA